MHESNRINFKPLLPPWILSNEYSAENIWRKRPFRKKKLRKSDVGLTLSSIVSFRLALRLGLEWRKIEVYTIRE